MFIKQISIFVENKPGRLSEITSVLAENGINIRALSIADTTDFGILRIIVSDPEKTAQVVRDAGFTVSITSVLAVSLKDQAGALAQVMNVLYQAGIAVEYIYAFIGSLAGEAYVIIRVEDNEKAVKVLQDGGIALLEAKKVYEM